MTELEKTLFKIADDVLPLSHGGREDFEKKGNVDKDSISVYVPLLKFVLLDAYELGVENEHKRITGEEKMIRDYSEIEQDKIVTDYAKEIY